MTFWSSISEHLAVLPVAVPMFAAPLCVVFNHARLAWALACAAAFIAAASAIGLFITTADGVIISYALGGWAPPIGIEYRIDRSNSFIALIVAVSGLITLLFAPKSVAKEVTASKQALFYAAFTLCLCGLLGIVVTGDAFNVFVFLEISSLSTYALISMGANRKALTAAYQYLIMGTIGATFFLIGVGLLYMMTGTLNMADLYQRLGDVSASRPVLAGFAFIVVGIALKAAIFPLHLWLPNAYAFAPSIVTMFLAATATKVSIYLLLRFSFSVFGASLAFDTFQLGWLVFVPAVAAIFVASIVATYQIDVKRLFAYSSVGQVGYITLALTLGTVEGTTAGLVYIFNHALTKGTIFAALACIFYRTGSMKLQTLAGIGWTMPWTSAAFVIAGLSLIGVPLTNGFISKWLLLQALLQAGDWWLVAALLLSSLIAIIYVWRIVEVAYFQTLPDGIVERREAPLGLLLPTLFLAAANIYFGIFTELPVAASQAAAAQIMQGFAP